MAIPGEAQRRIFKVTNGTTGAAVTGLVLAGFTVEAYAYNRVAGTTASYSPAAALTEIGSGWYVLTASMPPNPGSFTLQITSNAGHVVSPTQWSGEVESNDLDIIAGLATRPAVIVTGQGTIGQVTPISLVRSRYRLLEWQFTDQAGALIDMTVGTTYTNYAFSVRDKVDQTLTPPKYDQTTGFTTGLGYVRLAILEASSFFTYLTEGAAALTSREVRYELTADLVSPASETVPIVQSSPLYLLRREVGT